MLAEPTHPPRLGRQLRRIHLASIVWRCSSIRRSHSVISSRYVSKPKLDRKELALRQEGTLNSHSEQVTDGLFLTNQFFDARDLVQVKYEMVRRVQNDGQPIKPSGCGLWVLAALLLSGTGYLPAKRATSDDAAKNMGPSKLPSSPVRCWPLGCPLPLKDANGERQDRPLRRACRVRVLLSHRPPVGRLRLELRRPLRHMRFSTLLLLGWLRVGPALSRAPWPPSKPRCSLAPANLKSAGGPVTGQMRLQEA
jgi:hypothetical protein